MELSTSKNTYSESIEKSKELLMYICPNPNYNIKALLMDICPKKKKLKHSLYILEHQTYKEKMN